MHRDDVLIEIYRDVRKLERYIETERIRDHYTTLIEDYLFMPGLRGFWPFSSVSETGAVHDLSYQGRTLTPNGGVSRAMYNFTLPYCDFDGSNDYLSRADEAGLSLTSNFAIGCMVWLDSVAATQFVISKNNPTGNQRSYALSFQSAGNFRFQVSGNGSADVVVDSSGITISTGRWYFIAGRYTPSTEIALFVNNQKFVNTTSIPASVFDSTADFRIGVNGDGTGFLNGRVSFPFVTTWSIANEYQSHLFQRTRRPFGI